MEIFRDIKGYEGSYQISNYGSVKSLERKKTWSDGRKRTIQERIRKQYVHKGGYSIITLVLNNKRKTHYTHQLVAKAFLNHNNESRKIIVDHIDNDKRNNKLDNLQIITQRENVSKDKIGGSSEFVGACWHKSSKKWRAAIRNGDKRFYLGNFKTELDAHNAYQTELEKIQKMRK